MTIINSTEDQFYGDEKALGNVLAKIINSEIKALVSAGCKYIQVRQFFVTQCVTSSKCDVFYRSIGRWAEVSMLSIYFILLLLFLFKNIGKFFPAVSSASRLLFLVDSPPALPSDCHAVSPRDPRKAMQKTGF